MKPSNKILMKTPSIVVSLSRGTQKFFFNNQVLTIIDYFVFTFPGIVAPLGLLSNLSSN